jgi:hypothetical protein
LISTDESAGLLPLTDVIGLATAIVGSGELTTRYNIENRNPAAGLEKWGPQAISPRTRDSGTKSAAMRKCSSSKSTKATRTRSGSTHRTGQANNKTHPHGTPVFGAGIAGVRAGLVPGRRRPPADRKSTAGNSDSFACGRRKRVGFLLGERCGVCCGRCGPSRCYASFSRGAAQRLIWGAWCARAEFAVSAIADKVENLNYKVVAPPIIRVKRSQTSPR